MDIVLTGIGEENKAAFLPLIHGKEFIENHIAVGAIADDRAVGILLLEVIDDILMIDYIYVAEDYRRKHVATKMINGAIKEVSFAEPVALHVNYMGASEDLHGLFLSLNFKLFRDGTSYMVSSKAFMDSAAIKKIMAQKQRFMIIKVSDMTRAMRSKVQEAFEKADLYPDMAEDPTLSKDLSIISFDDAGNPKACVLAKDSEEAVVIHYLINFEKDTIALIDIIRAFSELVSEKYKDGCSVIFVTMDEKMRVFVEKLVGDDDLIKSNGPVISGIRMLSVRR